ncbi:MAG: ribonuclease P protein component [Candidatus Berkelbacteria bacterium]|nr:ribonuclease P protein component [Candidatus Berkelbacteria bacterium]
MLSRNFRLKKETDFRRIYQKGKRIRGFFFDITYLENQNNTRFGIVVTTRSINKATKRNFAKRILRDIIYKNKNLWPEKKDLIIKIKKEINQDRTKKIEEEFITLLKKI